MAINLRNWVKQAIRNSNSTKQDSRRNRRAKLRLESLEERRVMTAMPFGATDQDLGEFMLGTVAVTPVFLESDGSLDTSTENWSQSHIDEVLANIDEGLDWWVDTLANKSAIHELSFTVDTTFADTPIQTRYEPISRRSNDYSLYVSEFLTGQGFTTGNLESQIKEFNHSQRVKHDTNWSFTMFVVPSQNDSDGAFAVGGSFGRAFAFAGGLFMVVPSTRPASTFTHETGHMFWARDEYPGGGSYYARRGYYNTLNENASNNPNPGFVQQPSIMASGTLLNTAYANNDSPESTLAMLGWQDSDNDGIFDVLDVPHKLTGSGYFDEAAGSYEFSGSAIVQTLPNLNPSGLGNDITINRLTHIEYRVDGGAWQIIQEPNEAEVQLDLSIALPSTASTIELRARDAKSTVVSNSFVGRLGRADSTTEPGINGYVWIDANQNGLRDINEFGEQGWTVSVVDQNGIPLELAGGVEPDDLPAGQISSTFRDDLTLRSVGTDGEGRVGVFPDSGTSTGTMNFRGFSRGASSYLANWTDATRQLQTTFSQPTSVFQIDAIGVSNGARGRIDAYNSAGEIVARFTTEPLAAGEVATMTVERSEADIAYVNAGGHAFTSVKLDNLRFGPESTTTTDSRGGYTLPNLPAGQYEVLATPIGNYRSIGAGSMSVQVTSGQATVDVDFGFEVNDSQWQNPINALDVNDDTFVSPIDVLHVVNDINANGSRDLRGSGLQSPPYIDVNGDSFVSAIDVLSVVNYLNANT
ncbi:MAG: dockerin type I domain-containing protein [Aureliella sp.]